MLNYISEINEIAPPDPGGFPSLFSRRDLFLSSFSKITLSFSLQFHLSDMYILCQINLFMDLHNKKTAKQRHSRATAPYCDSNVNKRFSGLIFFQKVLIYIHRKNRADSSGGMQSQPAARTQNSGMYANILITGDHFHEKRLFFFFQRSFTCFKWL